MVNLGSIPGTPRKDHETKSTHRKAQIMAETMFYGSPRVGELNIGSYDAVVENIKGEIVYRTEGFYDCLQTEYLADSLADLMNHLNDEGALKVHKLTVQ